MRGALLTLLLASLPGPPVRRKPEPEPPDVEPEPDGWWESCSGCTELGENHQFAHHYDRHPVFGCFVGAGCNECDHTGIVWCEGGPSEAEAAQVSDVEPEPEPKPEPEPHRAHGWSESDFEEPAKPQPQRPPRKHKYTAGERVMRQDRPSPSTNEGGPS